MLIQNQTVYYTSGPLIHEATFLRYEGPNCILSTPLGDLKIRQSRVFTKDEAAKQGLVTKLKVTA